MPKRTDSQAKTPTRAFRKGPYRRRKPKTLKEFNEQVDKQVKEFEKWVNNR